MKKIDIQAKYDGFIEYFEETMPVAESELKFMNPYQLVFRTFSRCEVVVRGFAR